MAKKLVFKLLSRHVLQPVHRWRRGMTLGTRTVVFDDANRVLLVRHTYADGWMLPGGGVERGETIVESARREVLEEAGIMAGEEPVLVGVCNNDEHFRGDHVAIFVLRKFSRQPFTPNAEIAAAEFFDVSALPGDTTAGTRRRVAEVLAEGVVSHRW